MATKRPSKPPQPPANTSTFAPPAPLVAPSPHLPAHYVTAPDIDGACRFDFVEAKAAELGNPPDMARLYVWDQTIKFFSITDAHLVQAIQSNAHPANHPLGAPLWLGHRYGDKMPNGNLKPIGILPNTLTCIYGMTLEQFMAYIAQQTPQNYWRTPYASANDKPLPLGGGL